MEGLAKASDFMLNSSKLKNANFKPKATAPKNQVANTAYKADMPREIKEAVSISIEGKNAYKKNTGGNSGTININNHRVRYSLTENNDLIIEIIDKSTNQVKKQIPSEELLKIREALSEALAE